MKKIFSRLICLSILTILIIGLFSCLVGCSKQDITSKVTEKPFGDRSDKMQSIPISDSEFTTIVLQKITPISQDGNTLKATSIAIKNGRVDRSNEISKIDIMLDNVQDVRSSINNLNVSENKESTKESIVKALDDYSAELTDYKNLLDKDEITGDELQSKIDIVINDLEIVKQYAK